MFTEYLGGLRGLAERRMDESSRVAVMRNMGRTEPQDEDSGLEVTAWATVHVELPARFPPTRGGSGKSRTFTVGGVEVTLAVREMHVPYSTADLQDGDLAVVTDGRSAGSVWRIVDATPPADNATAYRLDVIATERPEEWDV